MRPRIYADWNDQTEEGRLWLNVLGSLRDLQRISVPPFSGMEVILYWDPSDPDFAYEMDAILEQEDPQAAWLARPLEGSIRTIPKHVGDGKRTIGTD
ncbi:hypothetical protein [uncultured Paludibaculum sp.]|uniref:hypothetical protein n=1 Tax=uncultured Paludibaculum sp. TaxID=1765020 RepID=UPI002AAC225D|nr:hypothetical protein [uncultured Paludibaculum sp.]